jgi:hypothetical protein
MPFISQNSVCLHFFVGDRFGYETTKSLNSSPPLQKKCTKPGKSLGKRRIRRLLRLVRALFLTPFGSFEDPLVDKPYTPTQILFLRMTFEPSRRNEREHRTSNERSLKRGANLGKTIWQYPRTHSTRSFDRSSEENNSIFRALGHSLNTDCTPSGWWTRICVQIDNPDSNKDEIKH